MKRWFGRLSSGTWPGWVVLATFPIASMCGCIGHPTAPDGGQSSGTQFTLTVEILGDGQGSTDPSPGAHVYAAGTVVTIQAQSADNSYVDRWSTTSTGSSCTVTMDADKKVEVLISRKRPNLKPVSQVNPLLPGLVMCGFGVTGTYNPPLIRVTNDGRAPIATPVRIDFGIWDMSSSRYWVLQSWTDFTGNKIWYPGQTYEMAKLSYRIPCDPPEGGYVYVIVVDPENKVAEANEGDNWSKGVLPIILRHPTAAAQADPASMRLAAKAI